MPRPLARGRTHPRRRRGDLSLGDAHARRAARRPPAASGPPGPGTGGPSAPRTTATACGRSTTRRGRGASPSPRRCPRCSPRARRPTSTRPRSPCSCASGSSSARTRRFARSARCRRARDSSGATAPSTCPDSRRPRRARSASRARRPSTATSTSSGPPSRAASCPGDDAAVPLSGGRDSRHILLELCRAGRPPRLAVTMRHYPPFSDEDAVVATEVARAAGVPHVVLPQGGDRFAAEIEKNRRTGFCADEHAWMLPLAAYLRGRVRYAYDGIGGDVLSAGLFLTPERVALAEAGRLEGSGRRDGRVPGTLARAPARARVGGAARPRRGHRAARPRARAPRGGAEPHRLVLLLESHAARDRAGPRTGSWARASRC